MVLFWVLIFVVSLVALVKGADWLLTSAEKIGLSFGLSPFIVGVTIVGLGTSFPELVSSLFAVFEGVTEIVPANAIGSNIANILLVVGLSALVGRRLSMSKSLIDLDLPLLAVTTVVFFGVAFDGIIAFRESILLLAMYAVYFLYTIFYKDDESSVPEEGAETLPSRQERRGHLTKPGKKEVAAQPKVAVLDYAFLVVGIVLLAAGAKYLIDSVIALSAIIGIGAGIISLAAVALGTSLPELLVSIKAALQKKSEVALGNIFGSNVFNILVVVGVPGLFATLELDVATFSLGLPILAAATFLFIVSGISRRVHMWEGAMYLGLYLFFIGKLFSFL